MGLPKIIHTGQVVEPGQLIGSVGSHQATGPLELQENSLHTSIMECIKDNGQNRMVL